MCAQPTRLRAIPRSSSCGEQKSHDKALIRSEEAMREQENPTPTLIQQVPNSTLLAPHPVVRSLSHWAKHELASLPEQAVLKYGRAFTGIARPKGYRLRAVKQCFANAGDLAL